MESSQPSDQHHEKLDVPFAIPDLARAWEAAPDVMSFVRRPSKLPDPQSYHEVIEPDAIFELDEKRADGSIETILVVPFGCERCCSCKQACSRMRPTCARCRNAGSRCEVSRKGYQKLPGPKLPKGSSKGSSSVSREPVSDRSRVGERASRVASSLPQASTSNPRSSNAAGSKRRLSPASASVPPRKKAYTKTTWRKGKERCDTNDTSETTDIENSKARPPAQSGTPGVLASERSGLKWTFVDGSRGRGESPSQSQAQSITSSTLIPRVWTNALDGLLTAFPQLVKTRTGLSWFQSETPILLVDTNYSRGHWVNSTTLSIDLLWDFSCSNLDLERVVDSETGNSAPLNSPQPEAHPPENDPACETVTMDLRHAHLPPENGSCPPCVEVSAPLPKSSAPMLPLDDATALNGSLTDSTTLQAYLKPCIPLIKPPEIEILQDSHVRLIPVLLWFSRDCGLVPCMVSSEFAYLCMGFFFISDLRREVIQHDIPPTTGVIQGRVRWSVTLQWAPGGEEALFCVDSVPSFDISAPLDTSRDLLCPWWLNSPDLLSQADNIAPYRPRDLRIQFSSYLALDLLAEFHPSESFPRGWFCKLCGLINTQTFFRHQICQSSICGSTSEKHISQGKADSLSSIRDPHRSNTLIHPTDDVPSVVKFRETTTWTDDMQSWTYGVKDGVTLCHVFTGNQEKLQEDATSLFERIQCEVLLSREHPSSPYFTHTTRLSHASDGSGTTVPTGTPACVRTAYYTLCDLVERYGELGKHRFGWVHVRAWVTSGSRRGIVFHASESPVVILCLGSEVVLNFTPMGGYDDDAESTTSDKGKEGGGDKDGSGGCPPAEPHAGPSHHIEQDGGDQDSFIPSHQGNEPPVIAENADQAAAAMDDAERHGGSFDAGSVAVPTSRALLSRPGMDTEVARPEVEQKQGCGRKKSKAIMDKGKAQVPEISMTLVHGDCAILVGDDFKCQIVRTGTTVLVIGFPLKTHDV